MIKLALIALSLTLIQCASTSWDEGIDRSTLPPNLDELAILNRPRDAKKSDFDEIKPTNQWWKKYKSAMEYRRSQPEESCKLFRELANDLKFPLRDLSELRASSVCNDISVPKEVPNEYLHLRALILLNKSKQTNTLEDDLDAYFELYKLESDRKNREYYLTLAISAANKLKLQNKVTELTELLYKNSPRLKPKLSDPGEILLAAHDFRFHRKFTNALKLYKQLYGNSKTSTNEKISLIKYIRLTYKLMQDKVNYIKSSLVWIDLAKKTDSGEQINEAYITHAKALWTENQPSSALEFLKQLEEILTVINYSKAELYYLIGKIDEEAGNADSALEYYSKSEVEKDLNKDLTDRRNWQKAWLLYKLGRHEEAITAFNKIIDESSNDQSNNQSDKWKAKYWLANLVSKRGDIIKHNELLEQIIQDDQLGYYGILAARKLNRQFSSLEKADHIDWKNQLYIIKSIPSETRVKTEWLISLNETDIAQKFLNGIETTLKKLNTSDDNYWFALYFAFGRSGEFNPLFQWISRSSTATKKYFIEHYPNIIFPTYYQDLITAAADKTNVPKEYIYSITRQESAFNPGARSPADAFGLMQILPNVAKVIADRNNIPYKEASDLYDPEINIPIGSYLLKQGLNNYQERYVLASASYNASDRAIQGWIEQRYRPDVTEFIEEIPYDETRNYIKLVTRNFVFYSRIFHSQPISFPEILLAWETTR